MGPSNSRLEIGEKYGIVKRCKNIQARTSGTHGALTDAANLQIGRFCLAPRRPLVAKTVVFQTLVATLRRAAATAQGNDRLAEDMSPADRHTVC